MKGLCIKIEALKSPSELENGSRKVFVPERVMTVEGLAYMRRARVGKDGKQMRDQAGKLEWETKPNADPSNARHLSFPYTEIRGQTSITVERFYDQSTLFLLIGASMTADNTDYGIEYGYRMKNATHGFYVINCGRV